MADSKPVGLHRFTGEHHWTEAVIEVVATRLNGEDRACVLELHDAVIAVVADGVGGTGNGGVAAQLIVDAVGALTHAPSDWCVFLEELDAEVSRKGSGRSTAVIVAVRDGMLSGASVGDSAAWLISNGELIDLTEDQQRRPFVGGGCIACATRSEPLNDGTLLVASDGLLNYAKRDDIVAAASGSNLCAAARELVDLVRLPNGKLQDDVAVILCRRAADK